MAYRCFTTFEINMNSMKKSALTLIVQIYFCAFAQTTSFRDFKIVEQGILYQKVFSQDSITKEALEKYYKPLPYI